VPDFIPIELRAVDGTLVARKLLPASPAPPGVIYWGRHIYVRSDADSAAAGHGVYIKSTMYTITDIRKTNEWN